jgi:hypothetical protein
MDKKVLAAARTAVIKIVVYRIKARNHIRWYGKKLKLESAGNIISRNISG